MNFHDYELVKNYDYSTYCSHLLEKYGSVGGDYYTSTFSQNMAIKRTDEGLYIHHIDEDKIANLSDYEVAKNNSFDYQRAGRLVYADLFEHILLHILIGEQNKGLGFGGAEIMFAQANDKIWEDADVLEILKERCRNSIAAYETLFEHNQTVFYELEDILAKNDRALVVIGTGLGKTTTALAYLRKYGVRGIVLGPNRIITDAWAKNKEVDVYTYQWFMNNYKTIDFSKYGVLICDEAHHCAAPKWGEGIRHVLDNGFIKVMGLTATPKEQKDKKNYETSSQFFKGCVCQGFTVLDGIERGIIHDFSYVGAIYDTSGIREKYSDLSDEKLKGELDLALNNTPTMEEIFRKHLPQSKRKGIVFCTDIKAIDEAEVIMRKVLPNAEFRRMHSLMGAEAEEARKWFEGTDEGWLFAVNMISEGAHYKGVNTIVMFRRTESSLVFNQQLGRIITLARDEDPEAIVFDLVNNANNIQESGKRFAGSLRAAYQKRKENGGKKKSEQVIVEDYAEKISEILERLTEKNKPAPIFCMETKKIFSSTSEVERELKILHSGVYGACIGIYHSSGGYHWKFYEEGDELKDWTLYIAKIEENRHKAGQPSKKVFRMEDNKIYFAIADAEKDTGAARQSIRKVCQGKQKSAGGYHWKFYEDGDEYKDWTDFIKNTEEKKLNCGGPRKVLCEETQEIFESGAIAERVKGIYRGGVSAVCKGSKKTAGGYHWRYVD